MSGLEVVKDGETAAWDAPADLPAVGQAEWRRLVPLLSLSEAQRETLRFYCAAFALHEIAAAQVFALGPTVEGRNGTGANIVKNPALQVMRDASMLALRWAVELGITPRSKGKLEHPVNKRTSERLLSSGG